MSAIDRPCYVYVHRRESDGRIFYIGKGRDRRAWSASGRNLHWKNVAKKHGWTAKIVKRDLPEPCALALEQALIAAVGIDNLANVVLGGGGTSGWRHSPETKVRIGSHWIGRKMTERQVEALRAYNTNKKLTPEHINKLRAAKAGKKRGPLSAETRAKISQAHTGSKASAEARHNMSLAKIGKAIGAASPSYDHTLRAFSHADGRRFQGTRGEFIAQYGLSSACVCALIKGRRKTVKGWRVA